MMLAQQTLDTLPAGFWKDFSGGIFVLLGAVGILIGIAAYFRKPEPTKLTDDPAIKVEKTSKRFNHDLFESRHGEVTRRLDVHDIQIKDLWDTMRHEDQATRVDVASKFEAISRALGRIEGKLERDK